MSNLLYCLIPAIASNDGNVWFFYNTTSCQQLSADDRAYATLSLRDRDIHTCLVPFPDAFTSVTALVNNPQQGVQLPGPIFKVYGVNIVCNPITSMNVWISLACDETGIYPNMVACVAHVMRPKYGMNLCKYACDYQGAWNNARINLRPKGNRYDNMTLCEIEIDY